jgi:hypothetical protein
MIEAMQLCRRIAPLFFEEPIHPQLRAKTWLQEGRFESRSDNRAG